MQNYFKNSIAFYYKHLLEKGCEDPVKIMISDFVNTVKITKEQMEYINKMTEQEFKMIDNILILIQKMKNDNKYDEKSLDLIEKGLANLKR